MQLASKVYQADDIMAVQELYHSNGWTDGLPVVPPTPEAVQACLEWAMMSPEQLIGIEPVRERAVTAEKLAINAVLAGCLPPKSRPGQASSCNSLGQVCCRTPCFTTTTTSAV